MINSAKYHNVRIPSPKELEARGPANARAASIALEGKLGEINAKGPKDSVKQLIADLDSATYPNHIQIALEKATRAYVQLDYCGKTSPFDIVRLIAQSELIDLATKMNKDSAKSEPPKPPPFRVVVWDSNQMGVISDPSSSTFRNLRDDAIVQFSVDRSILSSEVGSDARRIKELLTFAMAGNQYSGRPERIHPDVLDELCRDPGKEKSNRNNVEELLEGTENLLVSIPCLRAEEGKEYEAGNVNVIARPGAILAIHDPGCKFVSNRISELSKSLGKRDLDSAACLFLGLINSSISQIESQLRSAKKAVIEKALYIEEAISKNGGSSIGTETSSAIACKIRKYQRLVSLASGISDQAEKLYQDLSKARDLMLKVESDRDQHIRGLDDSRISLRNAVEGLKNGLNDLKDVRDGLKNIRTRRLLYTVIPIASVATILATASAAVPDPWRVGALIVTAVASAASGVVGYFTARSLDGPKSM